MADAMKVYRDSDLSLDILRAGTIAVIGYGNQGHAHALNLRDSGLQVVVGARMNGSGWKRAIADGFSPSSIDEAARHSNLIIVALPDEVAPDIYKESIEPVVSANQALGFIHGFNIHYRQIVPPEDVDVILVAPKGAGYKVRSAFVDGSGLPCLVAVHQDASTQAMPLALAWAAGIGGGHGGVFETTFADETETDLFGEQVSVVGGVTAIMQQAFETLVEAGYPAEQAYFECVHEVKFVVDLIHEQGLAGMRSHISKTAAFGDLSRGPRLGAILKPAMQEILQEIRDGHFAREWIAAHRENPDQLGHMIEKDRDSLLEKTGERLRRQIFGASQEDGAKNDARF